MFQVSQSKVKLWRRCPYAYHLRYVRRLKKKAKSRALQFGSVVHTILEDLSNGRSVGSSIKGIEKKQGKLFASEREMYGDILEDARHITKSYQKFWESRMPLKTVKIKGIGAEHEVEVDLCKGISLVMKIDGYAETSNGMRWLVERKTFSRMPSEDDRWRNVQSVLYYRFHGRSVKADGVLWDYVWSKPPTLPSMTESGKVSRKKIITLPSKVEDFIKENEVDKPTAKSLMATANACLPQYFKRVANSVSRRVEDEIVGDFVETAQVMSRMHGEYACRNVDRHCTWCEFEPICRAELTGSSPKSIIEREYERREKIQPELERVEGEEA